MKQIIEELDNEEIVDNNTLISDSAIQLKKGETCYVYRDWQVEAVKEKVLEKYGIEVEVRNNGWYYSLRARSDK